MFPATLASLPIGAMQGGSAAPASGRLALQHASTSRLIVFFTYFYTAVTFNPVDVADNLKKYGGYIPGIRPGKKTAEYIDHVLSRITFGGAHLPRGRLRAADDDHHAASTCPF